MARVDGQAEGESGEEAHGDGDEPGFGQDVLEILFLQAVVFGYKVHVVGEIGGIWALGLDVAVQSCGFAG